MSYKGTVKGNVIELEEPLPFKDGTLVEVSMRVVEKQPRKNSSEAWFRLAGTLTEEEAQAILKFVNVSINVQVIEHL